MDEPFRAFSFVDRIATVEPGVRVRGTYAIPDGLQSFPASLVAEAVGQLAAWSAMAVVDFQRRPVAGIAGRIELLAPVHAGQTLELTADLETADSEAVGYGGSAFVAGVPVLRLTHCVGPMVAMEDFDDPGAVRRRFGLLCGAGAKPGGYAGLPSFPLERAEGEPGKSARALLHVPAAARIFGDHFPRRPVFPGSLLMHANLQLAAACMDEVAPPPAGVPWVPREIRDMKLRAFIPPGDTLELEARLDELSGCTADLWWWDAQRQAAYRQRRVRFAREEGA